MVERGTERGRLVAAIAMAIFVVGGAPLVGQARALVMAAFASRYTSIVGGAVGILIGLATVTAVVRIRDRRAPRYLALAIAILVGVLFARAVHTGNPEVDVVESFHLVEYAFLTWLFYRAWRPVGDCSAFVLPLAAGTLVGTLDEWFQWFVPARVGELHDVLLNGVAVVCGLLFSIGVEPPERFTRALSPGSFTRVAVALAGTVLTCGLFVQTVHLGHEIDDPSAGVRFRSLYTREELEAASEDRTRRWRQVPPLEQGLFSREDHYLSEALWHVQRRNRARTEGEAVAAWRENLILETFYPPVLETSSYATPGGAQWSVDERADAARRTRGASGRYVSDAEPYPIYTWSIWTLWTMLLAGWGAMLAWVASGARRDRR